MPYIYERLTIYTTKPVEGKYRYNDKFQIYPSRRKPWQHGRYYYPVTLEMSFPQKGEHYFRFSNRYGSDQLTKQLIEMHHLLSVVTQFFFFGHIKSKKPIERFVNKSCEEIKKGNIKWYQDKALDDRNVEQFILPDYVESFFDAYFSLDADDLFVFRKACYLFYSGVELRSTNPSFSFASFVSAIETLMAHEAEPPAHCKECGQPKYRLRAGFRDFILKYGYGGKNSTEGNKFSNKLYDYRSKILHAGQLLMGDMFWHAPDNDDDIVDLEESFLHKELLGATRICLVNWALMHAHS